MSGFALEQIQARMAFYQRVTESKTVQPFAHQEAIHIFNVRRRPEEPLLYGLTDLHPRTDSKRKSWQWLKGYQSIKAPHQRERCASIPPHLRRCQTNK